METNDDPIPQQQQSSAPAIKLADSPNLSDSDHAEIALIWKFLKRPQDLDNSDIWPFVHIGDYKSLLVPKSPMSAGFIPECLIPFLEFDFGMYNSFGERSDHAAWSTDETEVRKMSNFWQNILFRILVTWMNCQEPRTRNSDKIRRIIYNLDGYGAFEKHSMVKHDQEENVISTQRPSHSPRIQENVEHRFNQTEAPTSEAQDRRLT